MSLQAAMRMMRMMLPFGAAVAEMVGSSRGEGITRKPAGQPPVAGACELVVESSSNDTMDARTLALSSNVSL